MKLLDLTLPTAAENVALDEALLLACEATDGGAEGLRLWEPQQPLVVLGRSSRAQDEVDLQACRQDRLPVVRRSSGGGAIVGAPGCLMYAVVLSYARRPELRAIDRAHRFVLESLCAALRRWVPELRRAGTSDLALDGRKVSGNSMRCLRGHLLYHGTLLYQMRPQLVGRYLRMPPRQPAYRAGRDHADFIATLPVGRDEIQAAVIDAFQARQIGTAWPRELTAKLVAEKYSRDAWNLPLA